MKYFISILFFLIGLFCKAQQNMVPNGNFETYSNCPENAQLHSAIPWLQPNIPTWGGSSDYYHTCVTNISPPPSAAGGFQWPHSGNGYAGIMLFWDTLNNNYNIDKWREYIEVGLAKNMVAKNKYCVRFYVSKNNHSSMAIKQIQGVLTNDTLKYFDNEYKYIQGVTPMMEADSIITDTLNWIIVEKEYTANGGERFLTIGNFSPGNQVDFYYGWPYQTNTMLGYYLFDDVSVYEQAEANAGNDTLITPSSSVQLGVSNARQDVFYTWVPSSGLSNPTIANPIASPTNTTTYVLIVTDTNSLSCSHQFYDTVTVKVGYTGLQNDENNKYLVNVYPNPANENVNINILNAQQLTNSTLLVYDVLGKLVLNQKITASNYTLNTKEFQNGIYLFKLKIEGEQEISNKIIIQH